MNTPALAHLAGAYFHQDWGLDAEDEWDVIDDFVRGTPDLAPLLPAEIDLLIAAAVTEDELMTHLDALGCEFTGQARYGGYRGWLTEVARRVREATT